ncbi:MAG: TauD/TfdA family dioxygenase [Rhodobacteraceae bacterium]|nr:TauD/TfdA family dioxygenase [Paracoccaceae bacterium]
MNDNINNDAFSGVTEGYWQLNNSVMYNSWRSQKLAAATASKSLDFIKIADLANPTSTERNLILTQCSKTNFALYAVQNQPKDDAEIAKALRRFTKHFNLKIAETHRSAGDHGVVALRVSEQENQRGFIPYSRKAMNWHTDGYYNAANDQIRSFVLHCARPADQGGQNQIIDPEIAYIRLRDLNPDFIAALMRPDAMSIPPNTESDGSIRPVSIGPVFAVENGNLIMRYTARTRSITWSAQAAPAAKALQHILETETGHMHQITLKAGQGVLSNNALHNRAGFDPSAQTGASQRLMYRIRFHNRLIRG